jgi:hypothetical protein
VNKTNVSAILKEAGFMDYRLDGAMEWINLVQDNVGWLALVNAVMNFGVA